MRHHDKEIVARAEALSYHDWNTVIKHKELFLQLVEEAIENESDEPMIFFESLITLVEKELAEVPDTKKTSGDHNLTGIREFFSHDPIRDALEAHFPDLRFPTLDRK